MKVRLQRFMADCGVASRRECEEMIAAGRVQVNGKTLTRMPVLIVPGEDVVTVDRQEISQDGSTGGLKEQTKVYLLLNKPKGILVTNFDPSDRKTVGELMTGIKERVFPVGRLDMDSRGALIMTNDGELANRLTHPRFGVEKTYVVEVDGRVGPTELEKVKRGMWLGPTPHGGGGGKGERTEKFKLSIVGRERGRTILEVKLAEGKNREIRRVMARIGHVVRDLNRVAIAGKVTIENLKVGSYRPLTDKEVEWLYKASSPEFHGTKRAATQAWYEAKEMEKERKRLQREAAEPKKSEAPAKKEPEFRERPERKGKKPFIPPSGRNAGKALGGNFIGRKRFEQTQHVEETPNHPLGHAANADE